MKMSKKRIFEILEVSTKDDALGRAYDLSLITLILLNVLAVLLGSIEKFSNDYEPFLYGFELFTVIIFSLEYALRLWACTDDSRYKEAVTGRIRFTMTPLAIIDLLAFLPFYLPMFIPMDLRMIRVLRLFRLFRLFKMVRYSESLKMLGLVCKAKKEELLITLFVGVILLVLSSSLMFFLEREAQPQAFSSIPAAMWWAVATLTTVGYGDLYPITPLGKLLGAFIAVLGIGMFALPAGILGSGFVDWIQRRNQPELACPHCGKNFVPSKSSSEEISEQES